MSRYQFLNGFQRSTYELISVFVSLVTFAVHSAPVPSLYLPCTFPVPSPYLPCTFPVGHLCRALGAWTATRALCRHVRLEIAPRPRRDRAEIMAGARISARLYLGEVDLSISPRPWLALASRRGGLKYLGEVE